MNTEMDNQPTVLHLAGGVIEPQLDAHSSAQGLAIINTILSLSGSALSTFITSAIVGGRLNIVHVQNSSLAGAVRFLLSLSHYSPLLHTY